MNSQFFRQYIDLLNEQQAPTRQETERRAKDLAAKMGVAAPNLIDFEAEGGVPVRINGDRVPPNLYTADEKKLIAAARTLSGGAAAAPPQRDGAASSSSVRTGQNPNIDDETRDRARRATGATTPSSSAPTSTTIQSDDDGYHLITTPDGKTVVAGPDDGKPTNKPGSQSQGAAAQSAATGNKPKPGSKVGYANPGTRAYQHWLNSKGVKVAIDGVYGPETQGAGAKLPKQFQPGGDPKMSYNDNKKASEEYMDMLSVGTAYNVIPAPGKPYVWLNSPIYLERMKKYGYDPKTGDPVGGRGGQAGSPGDSTLTPEQKTKLVSSLGSIEAVLAKYKIKTNESIDPLDALVLENINQYTPQEQFEIWRIISESDIYVPSNTGGRARDPGQQARMQMARNPNPMISRANDPFGMSGSSAPSPDAPQQRSRLGKFLGKLGGASGIGKRIAARAGASALAGPAAAVVGVGAAGWTAWEVGKALWDTFTKTELEDLEPQDQEIIKSNLQTILQFQKNPEMMQGLDPELKIRVERAMKGLNALAVNLNDNQLPTEKSATDNTSKAHAQPTTKAELEPNATPDKELTNIKKNAGVSSTNQGKFSIKGIKFGMTFDEVAQVAGKQSNYWYDLLKDFSIAGETGWIASPGGDINGSFTKEGVLGTLYLSIDPKDFSEIVEKFSSQYGKPKMSSTQVSNKLNYKDNNYTAQWKVQDATITIDRYNGSFTKGIVWISSDQASADYAQSQQAKKEKAKKDF